MIDVSKWGKFQIVDLFDLSLPKGDLQVKKVEDGDVPLITPSNFNNGMLQRISEHSQSTLYSKGSLTVDMFGNAYYQEEDFFVTAHGHVNVLLPKIVLNTYTGAFLATTIRAMFYDKYGFSEMCTQKVLKAESVHLPLASNGQPDWNYMESYMKAIMEESEKTLKSLSNTDNTKHLIGIDRWGIFSCRELFECKNTGNILARDVEDGSGVTPYVTASGYNNGVVGYIDASKYDIIKGHCILVGGKTFTITYQKDDFVSNDSHNFVIRIKDCEVSDLCYLYLVSVIYAYFGQKYSWSDAVTKDKLMNDSIPLPATPNGEPDWQYMESSMRKTIINAEQALRYLQVGA